MFAHQVIRQSQSLGLRACRAAFSASSKPDVIILGAGHNGLVAATLLARQGLQVQLLSICHASTSCCRIPLLHQYFFPQSRFRCMKLRPQWGAHAKQNILLRMRLVWGRPQVMQPEWLYLPVQCVASCYKVPVAGAYLLGVMPPELLKVIIKLNTCI